MIFSVLLVDDNEDHRFLTRRALAQLEREGRLVIHVARDGEDALAKLRGGLLPDLMLLDIKMPRVDGFEVLADVRRDPMTATLTVIVFTSSENRVDIDRAKRLGADDYVTKPLDARHFQEKVRDIVTARVKELSSR